MRDERLERGFARGDASAYDAAYRVFGPRMRAAALALLRDPEAAGECVQDVFLHLWRRRTAYSTARGSLEAFLVVCARNRALMRIRGEGRFRDAAQRIEPPGTYELDGDPIERERVARALAQLTDGQAAVVKRAYYGGMTLSEVASELGIPLGTVKGRLSDALRALRRSLVTEGSNAT